MHNSSSVVKSGSAIEQWLWLGPDCGGPLIPVHNDILQCCSEFECYLHHDSHFSPASALVRNIPAVLNSFAHIPILDYSCRNSMIKFSTPGNHSMTDTNTEQK